MKLRRRMAFQLTPLLDILLIVLFAYFLRVEEAVEKTDPQRTQAEIAQLQQELTDVNEMLAETQIESGMLQTETTAQLAAMRAQLNQMSERLENSLEQQKDLADLTTELFEVPPELIQAVFQANTADDRQRLQTEFEKLAAQNAESMLKHVVAHDELRKRCDLWEVHLQANGSVQFWTDITPRDDREDLAGDFRFFDLDALGDLRTNEQVERFESRAVDQFRDQMYRIYKTLPQPKSLVVILYTYPADVNLFMNEAAKSGLRNAADRMREDSTGRTRFEYAIMGFPENE